MRGRSYWVPAAGVAMLCLCGGRARGQGAVAARADAGEVAAAMAELKDAKGAVRYAAAKKLGAMGPAAAEAVPALIAMFGDFEKVDLPPRPMHYPDGKVVMEPAYDFPSEAASEACGKIGAAAIPALTEALPTSGQYPAAMALFMNGEAGIKPIVEAYRKGAIKAWALTCVPRSYNYNQVQAMYKPLHKELLAMLGDADAKVRRRGVEAYTDLQYKEAIGPLIGLLSETDDGLQYLVCRALYNQGEPAVGPLVEALKDENARRRQGAAKALGELKVEAAIGALSEASAGDEKAAEAALEALGRTGKGGVGALAEALRGSDVRLQYRAAEALGQIQDASAAEVLVANLEVRDAEVRRVVVRSLGRMGPEAGRGAGVKLLPLLGTDDLMLRNEVARALGELGEKTAVEPLLQVLFTGAPNAAASGPATAPALVFVPDLSPEPPRLDTGTTTRLSATTAPLFDTYSHDLDAYMRGTSHRHLLRSVRCNAAVALGTIGEGRAFEPLHTAMDLGGAELRAACATGLGLLHDPKAVTLLAPLLKEKEDGVVFAAVTALGRTHDAGAVGPLLEYLRAARGNPQGYAGNAAGSLMEIGPAATPLLTQFVREERDKELRVLALHHLPRDDARVVRTLVALLDEGDADVRHAAEEELQRFAKRDLGDKVAEWKAWWSEHRAEYPE